MLESEYEGLCSVHSGTYLHSVMLFLPLRGLAWEESEQAHSAVMIIKAMLYGMLFCIQARIDGDIIHSDRRTKGVVVCMQRVPKVCSYIVHVQPHSL